MTMNSPLWGAKLDHIRLDSAAPANLSAFYRDAFAMVEQPLDDGAILLRGRDRRLIIGAARGAGPGVGQPYSAFRAHINPCDHTHGRTGLSRMYCRTLSAVLSVVDFPDRIRKTKFGVPTASRPKLVASVAVLFK